MPVGLFEPTRRGWMRHKAAVTCSAMVMLAAGAAGAVYVLYSTGRAIVRNSSSGDSSGGGSSTSGQQ